MGSLGEIRPGAAWRGDRSRDRTFGESRHIGLTPAPHARDDAVIGRIGASNQPVPGLAERYQVMYRMGWAEALPAAVRRTWEYSVLTLKVIPSVC